MDDGAVKTTSHRFLPRFRALAMLAIAVGIGLAVVALITGDRGGVELGAVIGCISAVLGLVYLASPTWSLVVETSEEGLSVRRGAKARFALPWAEITRVIACPSNKTCFVNGGKPETSLLVPGIDAPASYDIADKSQLYDVILANVPGERVTITASLSPQP